MDNPIPPVSPVPPIPVVPPPLLSAKSQNWLKILLIIIGVLIVFGLLGNLYLLAKNPKSVAEIIPTPAPISATPTTAPTANWNTYTDQQLSISIKYPNNISVLRSVPGDMVMFSREKDSKKDFRTITTLDIYFRGKPGTTLQQALVGECATGEGGTCQEKFENITINNATGIKTLGPNYPYEDNYYLTSETGKSSVIRLFVFPKGDNPNEGLDTFREMVKTFKFLDQNQADPTANWKIYTNGLWNYSIKYPEDKLVACQYGDGNSQGFWPTPFNCPIGHDQIYEIGIVGSKQGEYKPYKKPASIKEIVINGIPAIQNQYIYGLEDGPLADYKESTEIVFTRNNGTITIQFIGTDKNKLERFDQILSTFQFLN